MGLTWKAHGQLDPLAPAIDALEGCLATSVGWLRHVEGLAARRGIGTGFITGSVDGAIVAAAGYYLVEHAEDVSRSYRWSPRCAAPADLAYPRLYLGAVNGHLYEPATTPGLAGRRLELLGAAGAHLAARHPGMPVAALFMPLPAGQEAPGYVTTLNHDAVLDVSQSSCLEGYLADLDRKRRQNARREARAATSLGGRSGPLARLDPDECAHLLAANAEKFGRRLSHAAASEEVESLQRCFGDELVAFGYRHAGRLRAVSIGIVHKDALYLRSIGIDAAYERAGLYTVIGYHEPIRFATGRGLKAIAFGINAARAKCLRGCRHRRLVGCAFDPQGQPQPLRPPALDGDDARHLATCPKRA